MNDVIREAADAGHMLCRQIEIEEGLNYGGVHSGMVVGTSHCNDVLEVFFVRRPEVNTTILRYCKKVGSIEANIVMSNIAMNTPIMLPCCQWDLVDKS